MSFATFLEPVEPEVMVSFARGAGASLAAPSRPALRMFAYQGLDVWCADGALLLRRRGGRHGLLRELPRSSFSMLRRRGSGRPAPVGARRRPAALLRNILGRGLVLSPGFSAGDIVHASTLGAIAIGSALRPLGGPLRSRLLD